MYYLIDLERTIGIGRTFYWKANKHGYTTLLTEAGLYSETAADEIVKEDHDKRTVKVHRDTVAGILRDN